MIEDTPSYREMMLMTHEDFVKILELVEPDITRYQVTGRATDINNSISCHWRDIQVFELPIPHLQICSLF